MLKTNTVYSDDEVIVAQSSPKGSGAIALIRLSGFGVRDLVASISKLPSNKSMQQLATHTVHYGSVLDSSQNIIDSVMFIVMDAPRTFTGQDTIEITCHNNPFLIERIIDASICAGARLAQAGEFSKRAFLNKKIDLLQAEAINELINANTQVAIRQSLSQLEGSFSNWLSGLESDLIKLINLCEVSFEFLDEEINFDDNIKEALKNILNTISNIERAFNQQQYIRQGYRVSLIGSVNVGKSSIFNKILNQNRSIVTNIAGTTRDVVEASIYRNSSYWTLVDTAGLRETNDIIEQAGIEKSLEEAVKADIILLVVDGSRLLSAEEVVIYNKILDNYTNKIIVVSNKSDLASCDNKIDHDILFSNLNLDDAKKLENLIEDKINLLMPASDMPFLLNQRQVNLLLSFKVKIEAISKSIQNSIQYEILSYDLRDALANLSELTGKSISEQAMDRVFKDFCIGK